MTPAGTPPRSPLQRLPPPPARPPPPTPGRPGLERVLGLVTEHEGHYRAQELRLADLARRLADCEAALAGQLEAGGCVGSPSGAAGAEPGAQE